MSFSKVLPVIDALKARLPKKWESGLTALARAAQSAPEGARLKDLVTRSFRELPEHQNSIRNIFAKGEVLPEYFSRNPIIPPEAIAKVWADLDLKGTPPPSVHGGLHRFLEDAAASLSRRENAAATAV